ncbi:hypothetical protein CcarbDRAFT_5249, partial [Clostridium carboxidivorans P7]
TLKILDNDKKLDYRTSVRYNINIKEIELKKLPNRKK